MTRSTETPVEPARGNQFRIAFAGQFGKLELMGKLYRHGDVLIEEVTSLPTAREKLTHTILANGEMTGHSHRIKESGQADLYEGPGALYLHVFGPQVSIVHEEHKTITLTTGYYRVWRQREYSPEEIRIVRD